MKNKIYIFFELYKDIFQAFLVLILVIAFSLLLIDFPSYRTNDYNKYTSSTTGIVEKIVEKKEWIQSFTGPTEITVAYQLYYSYTIDNKTYRKQFLITNKLAHKQYINRISDRIGQKDFPVKYNPNNPEQSLLDVFKLIE